MGILGEIIRSSMNIMSVEFEIWGYTLDLWQIFIFVVVIDVVAWVVWEVLLGD